jgi:transposase
MIDYETFCQIRLLAQEKDLKPSQIAAELGLDIKTVEKWMTRETFQPRQGARRPSKLDGFKKRIIAQLDRHPYTAQQIFQQLQQQGYAGGYTILKDYVRLVRPVRKPAYLLLEFAAGECAQVDWGQYGSVAVGSTRRRLSFFLMVLQPDALPRIHPVRSHGSLSLLPSTGLRVLWRRPAKNYDRQS